MAAMVFPQSRFNDKSVQKNSQIIFTKLKIIWTFTFSGEDFQSLHISETRINQGGPRTSLDPYEMRIFCGGPNKQYLYQLTNHFALESFTEVHFSVIQKQDLPTASMFLVISS